MEQVPLIIAGTHLLNSVAADGVMKFNDSESAPGWDLHPPQELYAGRESLNGESDMLREV